MKRILIIVAATLGMIAITAPVAEAQPARRPIAAYSLATPIGATGSGLVARAIIPAGASCPILSVVDNRGRRHSAQMRVRPNPANTGPAFSSLIACSLPIPAGSKQAYAGAIPIPAAMPTQVRKMAIFGDTGCRIKGDQVQNCSSPVAWPLAKISTAIGAEKPDVALFTGDFFYREDACPTDRTAYCGGSPAPVPGMPFKDTSDSWIADVFTPMADVLAAAPIVLTRGNHEACDRGGNGYFIYFDPREGTSGDCAPRLINGELKAPKDKLTDPYAVDIAVGAGRSLRVVSMDSAYKWDCEVSPLVAKYGQLFSQAASLTSTRQENWLLIHRPIFGWQPNTDCAPSGGWTVADEAVASRGKLGRYSMLLSSHIHLAEAVNIPGVPAQLVIGNGGTQLEQVPGVTFPATGPSFGGVSYPAPSSTWAALRFGYAIASPTSAATWAVTMKDPRGAAFAACRLASKTLTCAAK